MPTPSGGKTQTQHNTAKRWPLSELYGSGSIGKGEKKEKTRLKENIRLGISALIRNVIRSM